MNFLSISLLLFPFEMKLINHRCATSEKNEEEEEMSKYFKEKKTEPYDKAFTFVCFSASIWLFTQLG